MNLLRKIAFISASVVAFSHAQDGTFLGLDFGVNTKRGDFLAATSPLKTPSSLDYSIGMKIGYQRYFNNFIGIRTYLGANYIVTQKQTIVYPQMGGGGGTIKSQGDMQYKGFGLSGNIDAVLKYDFSKNFALGIYGGIGYEGTFYNDANVEIISHDGGGALELFGKVKDIKGNGLVYNVGFQAFIAQNHQIEVGVKFAPYYINAKSELSNRNKNIKNLGANSKALAGDTFFVGYRYLF